MIGSLRFSDVDRIVGLRTGESVYEAARRSGVRIIGACGGRGTCGSCMVRLEGSRKWERACQIRLDGDACVEIAPRSLAPVVRAEADGVAETFQIETRIATRVVRPKAPTLAHPVADDANALDGLTYGPRAVGALSNVLRGSDWSAELRLCGNRLIDAVEPGRPLLGFAVDLGTTNVAGFLIDLRSGERVAGFGIENPQVGWGGDVIARINAAVRDPHSAADLTATIRDALSALAHDLCLAIGSRERDIVDVVICGNTAMHHLLLGLPVSQLGRAPFVASLQHAIDVSAGSLGLAVCEDANVHVVGNIGGFVGGDHVAALLATETEWSGDGVSIVMDIGTNTEISVIHEGRILSASSPSGPALEGGNISCGMRAAEGAIEKVTVVDGRLQIATIAGVPPVGLCGSGVLDALAAARAAGLLNAGGRITASHPDAVMLEGKLCIRLADDVLLTQHDIRAIQLAKSAIRTATQMLLQAADLTERSIDRLLIAGAFGAYLSIESGVATGLLPDVPRMRIRQIGNGAGLGVRQILARQDARERARRLSQEATYIELSGRAGFQRAFLANLTLPEIAETPRTTS
jgi:uncharacterized 2Fe-2S/4Fe-4S cluster protein (DUF4445 family)